MTEPHRRRRRVRSDGDTSPPVPSPADLAALTSPVHDVAALTSPVHDVDPDPAGDDRDTERGLRGLVGGGSSQVSVAAAMRARDAARPSDADVAAAEANLMIIRRGWTPPPAPR